MNYITNNLIQLWKKVGNKPGWDISKQDNIIFLKSPTNIPNLNLAIIDGDCKNPDLIKNYFGEHTFGILQPKGKSNPLEKTALVTAEITEMHLSDDQLPILSHDRDITTLKDSSEVLEWCNVAAIVSGVDKNETFKFFDATYNINRSQLLCFKDADKIVGVGHFHIDDNDLVYISSINVLEQYRRKGIGQKIMNACLFNSKSLGGKFFALHASETGEFLYKKLGFKEVQKWNFCIL